MRQKKYCGDSSLEKLSEILENEKAKKIFLVTGQKSFKLSGAKNKLNKILTNNYNIEGFSDFSPNPKLEDIKRGFVKFEEKDYDIIIAIGGGSTIDVAKTIKLLHFNKSKTEIPLVAIPTTGGSGSEATHFIVYYIDKEKQSKGVPGLTLPNYVILDPSLIMSLPKSIMASTGIDALGQAIESYWSISSTEESKKLAKEAIILVLDNILDAVNNSTPETRYKMMQAANMAGAAINISKTTACHSIAYPITSYFKISHGHAVGMTLGELIKFNYGVSEKDCSDKRGVNYIKNTIMEISKILNCRNPKEAGDKIYSLMRSIGLETHFSEIGIKKSDLGIIIKNGLDPQRIKNNPREITKKWIKKILEKIY